MKWITIDEINAAAKKSELAAIECSRDHWIQILTATKGEVYDFQDRGHLPCTTYCALCQRYYDSKIVRCGECPVAKISQCDRESSVWRKAVTAFSEWIPGHISTARFREEAQPMMDLLNKVLEEANVN